MLITNLLLQVKDLLSFECDIMYECRVCRSIFRSLANFLLHKRKYCTDKFLVSHQLNNLFEVSFILHSDMVSICLNLDNVSNNIVEVLDCLITHL